MWWWFWSIQMVLFHVAALAVCNLVLHLQQRIFRIFDYFLAAVSVLGYMILCYFWLRM